jgi:hypothetical protein
MDSTKYSIKQINSMDFPAKKQIVNEIISTTSDPFRSNLPYDVFMKTDLAVAEASNEL